MMGRKAGRSENSMDVTVAAATQMEDLPDEIIHQIMAFLPTVDVNKFNILSKRLRCLMLSFPILDFDFAYSYSARSRTFFSFVEKSLQARDSNLDSCLRKLRFRYYPEGTNEALNSVVDNLVEFAARHHLEELDLNLEIITPNDMHSRPVSPKIILQLFSLTSITVLKLQGLHFSVPNLIIILPLLEFFSLHACTGLNLVIISSSCRRLKEVDFARWIDQGTQIHVEAPSLESFSYGDERYHGYENVVYSAVESLRKICLMNVNACKLYEQASSRFHLVSIMRVRNCKLPSSMYDHPNLKTLVVENCPGLERLVLSSQKLEYVVVENCLGLERVVVSSKKLESFKYGAPFILPQCEIDISVCNSLTNLRLVRAAITDMWVKDTISTSSLLEKLEFTGCSLLRKIEFSNQKLKTFELCFDCLEEVELEIDAPNLVHFSYHGSLIVRPLIVTSTKCHPQISLPEKVQSRVYWIFLQSFDHCSLLTLAASSAEGRMMNCITPSYQLHQ